MKSCLSIKRLPDSLPQSDMSCVISIALNDEIKKLSIDRQILKVAYWCFYNLSESDMSTSVHDWIDAIKLYDSILLFLIDSINNEFGHDLKQCYLCLIKCPFLLIKLRSFGVHHE